MTHLPSGPSDYFYESILLAYEQGELWSSRSPASMHREAAQAIDLGVRLEKDSLASFV